MEDVEQRLSEVEKTLNEHTDVLLGKWNIEKAERTPGIVEQLRFIIAVLKYAVVPGIVIDLLLQLGLKDSIPLAVKILAVAFSH